MALKVKVSDFFHNTVYLDDGPQVNGGLDCGVRNCASFRSWSPKFLDEFSFQPL